MSNNTNQVPPTSNTETSPISTMVDFLSTTSTILRLIQALPKVANSLYQQSQKNEAINKILQQLNWSPTEIPDNVDTVYMYALIDYGVSESYYMLELLRNKEIKNDFWQAYTHKTPLIFLEKVKFFLEKKVGLVELKEEIRNRNLELEVELEKFADSFVSYAKRTTSPKFKIDGVYPDWDLNVIPRDFRALIEEKTRLFCGRGFVFQKLDKFISRENKGYFTVIGDPGMGKSAISSKYVLSKKVPCYFNIFVRKENTPNNFLESIRKQLVKRYGLQNQEDTDLQTLVQKASEKLSEGEKLIILVDALDEVKQSREENDNNLLDLPQTLPKGVYFFLTRRPYDLINKRLNVSNDTPYEELDLREKQYEKYSEADIKEYIDLVLNRDDKYKDKLKDWLNQQNIDDYTFIDTLTKKSECNFMYLRYVLPSIAKSEYDDLSLKGLPNGLEGYYITHWKRMEMDQDNNDINAKILFILVIRGKPVSSEFIGDILDMDISDVEKILAKWREYIVPNLVETDEDEDEKTYYTIYHRSFLDFLEKQPKLNPKKNKRRFREINQQMFNYINR